jgi:hypothetical protein
VCHPDECAILMWPIVTCMQRIGFAECRHIQLLPVFQSALLLQPDTRCEVAESWSADPGVLFCNRFDTLVPIPSRQLSVTCTALPLVTDQTRSGRVCSTLPIHMQS